MGVVSCEKPGANNNIAVCVESDVSEDSVSRARRGFNVPAELAASWCGDKYTGEEWVDMDGKHNMMLALAVVEVRVVQYCLSEGEDRSVGGGGVALGTRSADR